MPPPSGHLRKHSRTGKELWTWTAGRRLWCMVLLLAQATPHLPPLVGQAEGRRAGQEWSAKHTWRRIPHPTRIYPRGSFLIKGVGHISLFTFIFKPDIFNLQVSLRHSKRQALVKTPLKGLRWSPKERCVWEPSGEGLEPS